MSSPCFDAVNRLDCPNRRAGCAATCPIWAKYETERNKKYNETLLAKEAGAAYRQLRDSRYEKWCKHQIKINRRRSHKGD